MKEKSYLLDTHILVWLLQDDRELNDNIRENIEYFQHSYYASVASLHEVILLMKEGKIDSKRGISDFIADVEERQIQFLDIKPNHMQVLEKLSAPYIGKDLHKDPFDRTIISQGIAEGLIVISADTVFPLYKDKGFRLLEN